MKRLLLGPLVALISSSVCLAITLLFVHILMPSPDLPPISVDPINSYKVSGKHFDSDFVTGVCLLHELPFKRGKPEASSRLLESNEEYKEAREELFPNSNHKRDNLTVPTQEGDSLIQYCEKCRGVEARWIKVHKDKR